MAKCVKDVSTGQISRQSNEQAKRLVEGKLGYVYVSKDEWKQQERAIAQEDSK